MVGYASNMSVLIVLTGIFIIIWHLVKHVHFEMDTLVCIQSISQMWRMKCLIKGNK